MTAVAEIVREGVTDIVALVDANPVMVLTNREKFNQFYAEMKAESDKLEPDTSTEKGRKAIASMAYKVARTKTAIDDAGKKLNEEARARINAVDESRREIRQQLDDLRDEVRKPLTEWETAEAAREEKCKAIIEALRNAVVLPFGASASDARERLGEVEAISLDDDELQGYAPQAALLREQAVATLTFQVDQLDREEAGRAELERLRAESEERQRKESEKAAAEAAERQRAEAEKAEADRKAKEEADQQARVEAAAKAAAENAKAEADRKHAEELAAEKRRADELEAAANAEKARVAREAAAQKAEADRVAADQARREADQAHRTNIMGEVKRALMTCDVTEPQARAIVLAIVGNNVPHTTITF